MTGPEPAIDEHAEIESRFSEYYEQTLGADEAAGMKRHLDGCERCTAAYTSFQATVRALSGMHRMSAPQAFEQHVEETIHRRSAGRFFGRKAFGDRVPFELLAVVALVIGIAVFILIYTSQTGSLRYERKQDTPEIAPGARDVVPRPDLVQD